MNKIKTYDPECAQNHAYMEEDMNGLGSYVAIEDYDKLWEASIAALRSCSFYKDEATYLLRRELERLDELS